MLISKVTLYISTSSKQLVLLEVIIILKKNNPVTVNKA